MLARTQPSTQGRSGKILVLFALLLPAIIGMAALTLDASLLLTAAQRVQYVADAAATAAATQLRLGKGIAEATTAAQACVHSYNNLPAAQVTLTRPPATGPLAGSTSHVEVTVQWDVACYFIHLITGPSVRQVSARAVAGYEDATAGSAVMILDPDPPPFQLGVVTPLLPPLPAILGGLEVLGVGQVEVDGAVIVNTTWGGEDEQGEPAGTSSGPPYAISATPLVALSRLKATDIHVVGGVDDLSNYGPLTTGGDPPLKCNRLPTPDPFASLTVPTTASDPANVKTTNYGGKTVVGLPLIGPPVTLQPGVYDYIEVVSSIANFQPGVYIIRGKHPVTKLSLSVVAGKVTASGVMFYITDSAGYSATTGAPDASDGAASPPAVDVAALLPAAVINIGLLNSSYSGLNSPGSPFDGMLIYQRRHDRRPIVLVQENLLGAGQLSGTVYSKWGHVILAGKGTYDARFAVGTMRIVALLVCRIDPTNLLPAAREVYLVE